MAEFRNILAGGDLIRQRKAAGWWLFGEKEWRPYRNLSREVRYLEERMHAAHAAYKAAQEDYVVAHTNVRYDMDLLHMHKMDNSEVSFELPSDESILSRVDGRKYSTNNNQNQKQKGSGGGNGNQNNGQKGGGDGGNNNQNQNQKGNGQQQNQNQQKGKGAGVVTVGQLLNAKLVLH